MVKPFVSRSEGRGVLSGRPPLSSQARLFQKRIWVVAGATEQKVVDFDKIEEHKDPDTGFCCLCVPSGGGISQEDYIRITRDYCVSSAQIAKEQGCKHFTLVTGGGTKKRSWYFFGRIKYAVSRGAICPVHISIKTKLNGTYGDLDCTIAFVKTTKRYRKAALEEKVEEMNFDRLSIFRSGLILGDWRETRAADTLFKICLKPIIYFFPALLSIPDSIFARGIIVNAVRPPNSPITEIKENKVIHRMAKIWKD